MKQRRQSIWAIGYLSKPVFLLAAVALAAAVLGVARVGVRDNFFELGGDSILSIQMVSRLRAKGFECSPLELFQNRSCYSISAMRKPAADLSGSKPEATENCEENAPYGLYPMVSHLAESLNLAESLK